MNNLINVLQSLKKLWLVLIITMLLVNLSPVTVFAEDANPPTPDANPAVIHWKTVPTDPNRVLSPDEIKLRDSKYRALKQFMQLPKGSVPLSVTLIVGTWKEPNDAKHINYCGPGATQVALDARWSAAKVWGLDKIGLAEKTNIPPSMPGTAMQDIYTTINSKAYLGGEFPNPNGMQRYWLDLAQSDIDLFYKASFDLTRGYALITGVNTKGMLGWGAYKVPHIVAVIGYNVSQTNAISIKYVETSASAAGFNGNYRNTVPLASFFRYVLGLNTLIW